MAKFHIELTAEVKGRRGYRLSDWVRAIVEPVTIGVRDTRTGKEHKVEVPGNLRSPRDKE